jgi:AraC family transcriptional regulator
MTLNVQLVDMATVPIVLPARSPYRLAFRPLSGSRLIAADIRYGGTRTGHDPDVPIQPRVTTDCRWSDAYTIGVRLRDETSDVFLDGRIYSEPRRKGEVHLMYLSGVEHIDFNTPRHTLEIVVPQSFLREIADDLEVPPVTHLGDSLYHVADDPVLRGLILRLQPYFDAPETLEPLAADHLMWGLGIYACAHYGDLAARRRTAGGLSSWQERLAKDIIETRLVGGIGLAELAGLCGLQTSRFAHAFKRSTGVAPYRWLQQRRVTRARELLATSRASLADIALACGFADQSHLTRSFARQLGITPGAWRTTQANGFPALA